MASFLFWNLDKNRIAERVARLVRTYGIDVLMLAECVIDPKGLNSAIEAEGGGKFQLHGSSQAKVKIFSRLEDTDLVEKFTGTLGRLRVSEIYLPGLNVILLAVAHLPDRLTRSRGGLAQSATLWSKQIKDIEEKVGHRRTVLVGDLNMNPFEDGVVSGHGFHAVMTTAKASQVSRSIDGDPSPFFYNPMWGFFGDRTLGPPGTYYRAATDPINYFWNIYDQVLVRPEVIPLLQDLTILDHDGRESLTTSEGLPNRHHCSDHLPLLFRLIGK